MFAQDLCPSQIEKIERSETINFHFSIFISPINRDHRYAPTGFAGLGFNYKEVRYAILAAPGIDGRRNRGGQYYYQYNVE
jgi:hypothetical protein